MPDFSALLNAEYHWPEKGDRLLSGKSQWPTGATIDKFDQTFSCFLWTFTNAAETLVKSVTDGRQPAARIFWPVLYLYRHAVELALKVCVAETSAVLGKLDIKMEGHRLLQLKDALFENLAALDLPVDDDSALGFTSVLCDLDSIDPNGTAFRYPTKLNGAPHGLEGRSIDLLELQKGAMKLINYLHDISEEMSQRSSYDGGY